MTGSTLPTLSVILVNWNAGHYLRECLPSIAPGAAGLQHEVIVVDCASTRDDVDALAAEFPSVRFVRSAENLGFARANNLGYQHSSGEMLLFLNPDTVVVGTAIADMVQTLAALPQAGILGCKLLNTDGSVQMSALQPFPTILNQLLGTDYLQAKWPRCPLWRLGPLLDATEPVPVQGVSGACLLMRRDVFARVGLFSEEYFMYAEDIDLCYKAAAAGFQTWFTPGAVVVHHGGGSSQQHAVSSWSAVVQQQAKYRFLRKFRGHLYAECFRVTMGLAAAARVVVLGLARVMRSGPGAQRLGHAIAKWAAIFRWSFGFSGTS